jgi:hypothetical protein
MAKKEKGLIRKAAKTLQAKCCCGCSILSWEKKFDKFKELYFSDTLYLKQTISNTG